jgi:hypothetical protein
VVTIKVRKTTPLLSHGADLEVYRYQDIVACQKSDPVTITFFCDDMRHARLSLRGASRNYQQDHSPAFKPVYNHADLFGKDK